MPASARRSVYLMETYWAGSTGRRNTFSLTGLQALVQSFGGSSCGSHKSYLPQKS